jgi:hypothetical protein
MKPSETLRRARRWARGWKAAAHHWYQVAHAFQRVSSIWQGIANNCRRELIVERQVQGLECTPRGCCRNCGSWVDTYRSSVTKKLHARTHFAIDTIGLCSGQFQQVRFADDPIN